MKQSSRNYLPAAEFCAWLYCFINVGEGAIRWILAGVHLEMLLYLRDVVLFLGLGLGLLHALSTGDRRTLRIVMIMALGAVFWTAVGESFSKNWAQSLFGLKSFLPLFAGVAIKSGFLQARKYFKWIFLLWFAAAAGVGLSASVNLPWAGFTYDIGDAAIEGQRQWTIDGEDRVGGLARNSADAASHVGLFGLALLCATRRRPMQLLYVAASLMAMLLTTARSPLIGFSVAVLVWMVVDSRPLRSLRWFLLPIPLLSAILATLGMKFPAVLDFIADVGGGGMSNTQSFTTRANEVWRDALYLLKEQGSYLLGRGIGGIGSGQKHFEPEIYNPADSFFIFILVTFGIVGAVLIFSVLMRGWYSKLTDAQEHVFPLVCGAFFFATGVTLNTPEIAFLLLTASTTFFAEKDEEEDFDSLSEEELPEDDSEWEERPVYLSRKEHLP